MQNFDQVSTRRAGKYLYSFAERYLHLCSERFKVLLFTCRTMNAFLLRELKGISIRERSANRISAQGAEAHL
jgi:hypothetical protein